MSHFKYKWGKRDDAAHTITLSGVFTQAQARRMAEGFIRQTRRGVEWRITYGPTVLDSGIGPDVPWLGVSV